MNSDLNFSQIKTNSIKYYSSFPSGPHATANAFPFAIVEMV